MLWTAILGIPSWHQQYQHWQLQKATRQLQLAFARAKHLARDRGTVAIVCPKGSGDFCGVDWHQGQVVLLQGQVLASYPPLSSSIKLKWQGFPQDDKFFFYPRDYLGQNNGHFTVTSQTESKQLIFNTGGRLRLRSLS